MSKTVEKIITVAGIKFDRTDVANARNWFNRNNDEPLGRGRMPYSILTDWDSANRPEVAAPIEYVATVFYRKIDAKGRPNGKTREHMISRDDMRNAGAGKGRPSTELYLIASGLTPEDSRITRIVTDGGAIHSVAIDPETDEYVIRWESKADQKEVVLSLMHSLMQYRNAAVDAGADVSGIDAEMDN